MAKLAEKWNGRLTGVWRLAVLTLLVFGIGASWTHARNGIDENRRALQEVKARYELQAERTNSRLLELDKKMVKVLTKMGIEEKEWRPSK